MTSSPRALAASTPPATSTEASPNPAARARHLAGLDGLRAVAVILVIAFHYTTALASDGTGLAGGFIGVDVFFVISGFLITGLLIRERAATGRIGLGGFWIRRARRLLPALAAVVVVATAAAAAIGGDLLVGLGRQVLGAATFSSNWLMIVDGSDYFDHTAPELFRNLWSLAVEEQFYLVWPLIMLVLLRWHRVIGAAVSAAIALGSAILLVVIDPLERVYYGTDTHAFGLALGAAAAFLLADRFTSPAPAPTRRAVRTGADLIGVAGLAGIVTVSAAIGFTDPAGVRLALVAATVASLAVVVATTTPGSRLGRALDVAPLRWVGERSYGLYLWHWPVLLLCAAALGPAAPRWLASAIGIVITVVAAALSYRFLETPIRRMGLRGWLDSLGRRPRGTRAVTGILTVAALAVGALTVSTVATAPTQSQAELAILAGQAAVDEAGASASPAPAPTAISATTGTVPAPSAGNPLPAGDQILAIGDSVMLAAAPELLAQYPGIAIDAAVSRSMGVAPDLVAAMAAAGQLRPVLIVGLGTNGPVDPEDLQAVVDVAGPGTQVLFVNAQAPRDWIPGVNATLTDFARTKRLVEIADWYGTAQPVLGLLASDEIHPGSDAAPYYVAAITAGLQHLADLPPLRDDTLPGYVPRIV